MVSTISEFDIRNFSDSLIKGKNGKYECPACGQMKLSINRKNGKYNCYGCGDAKAIYRKLYQPDEASFTVKSPDEPIIAYYISDRHKEEFRASAIPDDWARINFRTLDNNKEIAKFLGWRGYQHTPGWMTTGIDPVTCAKTELGQFKPDEILVFPDGSQAKYLTQKKGYEVMCPAVPRQSSSYWQNIANDSTIAIRLTEGMKKAIASMAHTGMPTIAGCGVEMFLKDGQLTPILKQFANPGRLFEIAFDADIVRKPEVRNALDRLAKVLLDTGCQVTVRLWDEKFGKGIDDVIFNGHNFDEVSETFNPRELAKKWEKQFSSKETNDKKQSPPKQTVFINQLVDKYRNRLAYDPKRKIWLHYGADSDGIWAKEEDVFICRMLKNEVDVNYPKGCSAGYIEGALKALKWELAVKNWDEDNELLPLENGVLRLSDKKLLKHSPKYHLTWCLPYSYKPAATCEPIIDWFKEMVGESDQIELLRCYLATIVRGDNHLHRFVELIGPGGTGKSTFTNLAIALVGQNNTHSTTLNKLENSRFETANIADKRLVVINDSERYGGDVSTLKALTGSDCLPFEVKWHQSESGFYPKASVIMTANEPIQSGDYTSGLKRRRISLKFTNQVPNNQQRNLINIGKQGITGDWINYLPGLLNWVLEANEETIFNYLKRTDEFCPSLKQHQIDSLLDSNPLADWADEHLVIREDVRSGVGVAKQDKRPDSQTRYWNVESWLYASYAERCFNTGTKSVAVRRFGTLLDDLLNNQLGLDIKKGRDRNGSYFKGIAIRTETDTDPLLISGNSIDDFLSDLRCETEEPPDEEPPMDPDPVLSTEDIASMTDTVTDNVTVEILVSDGCDEYDKKLPLISTESPIMSASVKEDVVKLPENNLDPYKEAGLTPEEVDELEKLAKQREPRFKLGDRVEILDSGIKGNIIQRGATQNTYWINSRDLPKAQFVSSSNLRVVIE